MNGNRISVIIYLIGLAFIIWFTSTYSVPASAPLIALLLAIGVCAILDRVRHGWRAPPMRMRDPVTALVFTAAYIAIHVGLSLVAVTPP